MIILKVLLFAISVFGTYLVFNFNKNVPYRTLQKVLSTGLSLMLILIIPVPTFSSLDLFALYFLTILVYFLMLVVGFINEYPYWEDWYLPYF